MPSSCARSVSGISSSGSFFAPGTAKAAGRLFGQVDFAPTAAGFAAGSAVRVVAVCVVRVVVAAVVVAAVVVVAVVVVAAVVVAAVVVAAVVVAAVVVGLATSAGMTSVAAYGDASSARPLWPYVPLRFSLRTTSGAPVSYTLTPGAGDCETTVFAAKP